jgi:hypothetical protein
VDNEDLEEDQLSFILILSFVGYKIPLVPKFENGKNIIAV